MRMKLRAAMLVMAIVFGAWPVAAAVLGPGYPAPGGNTFTPGSGDTGTAGGRTSTYGGFDTAAWDTLYWGFQAAPALSLNGNSYEGAEPMTFTTAVGNVAVWNGSTSWCYSQNSQTYTVPTRLTLTATDSGGPVAWSGLQRIPVAGTFYMNFFFEVQNPLNSQWQPAKSFFDGATGYTRCDGGLSMGRSTNGAFWYTPPVTALGPVYPAPGGNTFANGSGDPGWAGGRTSTYGGFNPAAYETLYWGLSAAPGLSLDGTAYSGAENMSFASFTGNQAQWTGSTYWCYANNSVTYPVNTRLTLTATNGAGAVNWIYSELNGIDANGFPVVPVAGEFYLNVFFEAFNPIANQWQPARSFFDGATGYNRCNSGTAMGRSTSGGFWYTPPSNQPPVLGAIGDQNVDSGSLLSFTVSAVDPESQAITYSSTALLSDATFNTSTGAFSWTPLFAQVGDHPVTFTATDAGGAQDSEAITIHVNAPSSNVAPVLADVDCARIQAGNELAFSLSAIDGNGDTISYSATGLPALASLNSSTGAFSWTPAQEQAGVYSVTFYASDGSLSDSDAVQIAVGAFAAGSSNDVDFDIYNQGRGNSAPSHARAWLSDRASLDVHPLGSGKDEELTVELDPPPGSPDPNSTPVLSPGDMLHYTASVTIGDGFGRLAHDGDSNNAAVENEDGTFTVTTTSSTASRVGFLFERYLWVDADGARAEGGAKLDEAGQTREELLANDAQKTSVSVLSPTFGELAQLSATFTTDAGGAGDGTPRLEVHFLCHGTLRIRLDGTNESALNVIGDGSARFDTTGLTGTAGPLSSAATYDEALDLAGSLVITRIDFVADDPGGAGTRTYTLSSINVGTGGE